MEAVKPISMTKIHAPVLVGSLDARRQGSVRDIRKDPGVKAIRINGIHIAGRFRIPAPGIGIGLTEIIGTKSIEAYIVAQGNRCIEPRIEIAAFCIAKLPPVQAWVKPVGTASVPIVPGQIDKSALPDLKSVIGAQLYVFAIQSFAPGIVLGVVRTHIEISRETFALLQDDVDHACNGIGTILGRRPVPEDFDALNGGCRNRIEVGAGISSSTRSIQIHQGRLMPPFSIDQDQRLIRTKAS